MTLRNSPESWRVADCAAVLGRAYLGLERHADAEPLLLQAYADLAEKKGERHDLTRRAAGYLAEFYVTIGDEQSAARYADLAG